MLGSSGKACEVETFVEAQTGRGGGGGSKEELLELTVCVSIGAGGKERG
jgi:hypothetical protein